MVDALQRIHAALAPGALLVDTQPVAPHATVLAGEAELGAIDQSEFLATAVEVDALVGSSPLFELVHEERLVVRDRFDSGPACLDEVSTWGGTTIPSALAERLRRTPGPVAVAQDVRLRVLRAALH